MARNRLHLLLSIRQRAVDQAMQALAACIAAEQEAALRLRSIDAAAAAERAAAERAAAGRSEDAMPDMEAFARWAAWTRVRRKDAAAVLAEAEARTAPVRAALAEAQAAARAVEELIAAREADARLREAAREQHMLDDVAARLRRDRGAPDVAAPQ